jgi:acetyltransferase EpsM
MKIVIIGGRGNGTVVASTIEDCKKAGQNIHCIGFLNDDEKEINGYPVVGKIRNKDWEKLPNDVMFIYTMSKVKLAYERHMMLKNLAIPLSRFANVVHPTAIVSNQATMGRGNVPMAFAQLGPNATIGNHTLLFTHSYVGHDDTVGEFVFLAAYASTGAWCYIGDGVHLGHKSSMLTRIKIGKYAVTGLGAVVTKDINDFEIVAGVPAKVIGKIDKHI